MKNIIVRRASVADRRAVYEWFGDAYYAPFVREYKNVSYEQHCDWFNKMLAHKHLYIGTVDNIRFGLILIDGSTEAFIEVFIKHNFCGKNLIKSFVNAVIPLAVESGVHNLLWVPYYNKAYYKELFVELGFNIQGANDKECFVRSLV